MPLQKARAVAGGLIVCSAGGALFAFLGTPQRILSRDQLLELSRGYDDDTFDRSIDVQILRLRRKIEADPSRPDLIKTERGAGYFFNAKVDAVV